MRLFVFTLLVICLSNLTLTGQGIEWLSWEEAIARNAEAPRKIMVDVYTDWCGWCKKMDKTSFVDPEVATYVNENFYAVKLDAEQQDDITFDGHTFSYDPSVGRRGVHALAVALLDGRMSYPSIVYLDEAQKRITISPGFKQAPALLREIRYVGDGRFREMSYEDYLKKVN